MRIRASAYGQPCPVVPNRLVFLPVFIVIAMFLSNAAYADLLKFAPSYTNPTPDFRLSTAETIEIEVSEDNFSGSLQKFTRRPPSSRVIEKQRPKEKVNGRLHKFHSSLKKAGFEPGPDGYVKALAEGFINANTVSTLELKLSEKTFKEVLYEGSSDKRRNLSLTLEVFLLRQDTHPDMKILAFQYGKQEKAVKRFASEQSSESKAVFCNPKTHGFVKVDLLHLKQLCNPGNQRRFLTGYLSFIRKYYQ